MCHIEREEKMTADITEKKLYAGVRNRYDLWAIFPKTDAEIIIAQEKELKSVRGQIDDLKKLADKAYEEIKKLNEENKALIEENAKLKKESAVFEMPFIMYKGNKYRATTFCIHEDCEVGQYIELKGVKLVE